MKCQHLPLLLLALSSMAEANLIDRGNGLIYDQDLNITWLADANYAKTSGFDADGRMDWQSSNSWAAGLIYGGYSDWRLPTRPAGSSDGSNQTSSEMGHLFYNELGGVAQQSLAGTHNASYNLFSNLQDSVYWTGPEDGVNAGIFYFSDGYQYHTTKNDNMSAWAVRPGDVAVMPVPPAVWLLGSGLLGLLGLRRRGNIG
ncbi:MAG: DUF1566 domain-containing protein [Methylococcales bacterium]